MSRSGFTVTMDCHRLKQKVDPAAVIPPNVISRPKDPSSPKSTVNLSVENYPLNQASLSANPGLSIELKKALANLDLDATILNNHISSKLKTGLK